MLHLELHAQILCFFQPSHTCVTLNIEIMVIQSGNFVGFALDLPKQMQIFVINSVFSAFTVE